MIKPEDLTRERTLFSLYRLSFKFPGSRFNKTLTLAALVCTALWCWMLRASPERIVSHFRRIIELDFVFATTILGFLIAGFTIFVTITKIDIFIEMAQKEYEKTGESYLKYNLNAFVLVFAHYIAFLFYCLCIQIFGNNDGLAEKVLVLVLAVYPQSADWLRWSVASIFMTLTGAWSVYIVLLLKSFIYNTYQVVTTAVRWELEKASEASHNDS